ncbi:LysR family transcriptional regulator [Mangrovicoccus sp. HB161399]|uniref:LysR family transcriptional regulator n=1 Tax=Mangrovicoccus sp. HB161399 TaxID=2720392 RepID=UPI0015582982|nr:LysR family transcriptional regulator [Mangrovicoccus sp. HB161399]
MRHLEQLGYVEAIVKAGSIRKAAETLAITSTALNRRVLALEAELGVPVFERLPRGVRLSTAGELLIAHVRAQQSEFEKLKSQLADLAGERRGHVNIACSQALVPYFLPEQIAEYRAEHPRVTFGVSVRDREVAEEALVDLSADIALIFEPVRLREVQVIAAVPQPVYGVMSRDHPLAGCDVLRLRDCADYPLALPSQRFGVRHLWDSAVLNSSLPLDVALEADSFEFLRNYPRHEQVIGFQIPIGLPQGEPGSGIAARPVDPRDLPSGRLYLCQLRNRALPVAAAKFAGQIERALDARYR